MVLLGNENLCDTIIYGNTDVSRNNITEITYSILSSLHISGAEYSDK